jgi:hypothetical protein
MPQHTVEQGECISSIALKYGHFWKTIWDHSSNSELRGKRTDPRVLNPGDTVFVPEKTLKEESAATGQTYRFVRRGMTERLRIVVADPEDKPRGNTPYILDIDGNERRGTTNGSGLIDEEIPVDARSGTLTVGEGDDIDEYELELSHLDPADEPTGVQGRLANLGFDVGPADGDVGPRTKEALKQFQNQYGLKPTGEIDEATCRKLDDEAKA